jgi:predicted transcriptional regulator
MPVFSFLNRLLDTLDIRNCTKITDEGVIILSKMNNLKSIYIDGCINITEKGIKLIENKIKK